MDARTTLAAITTTIGVAALVLTGPGAQARPSYELIDRSAFDPAPTAVAGGWTMSAPTRGELGGHLTLTLRASDGTLPGANECEEATAEATLVTTPGETFRVSATGEVCGHFADGSPSFFGAAGRKDVSYAGPRRKPHVKSAFVGFGHDWLGAQGSVSLTLKG